MKWRCRIAFLMVLAMILSYPTKAYASSDTKISNEIVCMGHDDWYYYNTTRPEQEFSDVFKATVVFKPTHVSAKANRNSITVSADCNTAVRVIIVEYSYDEQFLWSERRVFRNVKYVTPVTVTRKSQQKRDYKTKLYSSSNYISFN